MAAEDEDTPDLYRNSALDLYEGELEPRHRDNTPSSEGEDQFDDEDADMVDLDEGAMLGSDLSDASDEDGDVIAKIGRDTDTLEGDHDDKDDMRMKMIKMMMTKMMIIMMITMSTML
ncbi:hypothetical protein PPACK8108_LOCUS6014, partial [Phakopsora pachyrhizi]